MLTPFEHSNHVAKHNLPKEKLDLWTTATSGQTITPCVDFPAQYAGRVYWQISDGTLKPATSGAEISHTFAADGPHRVRLIGVPVAELTRIDAPSDYLTGDIGKIRWNLYRNLVTLYLSSTSVSGDIANLAGLSELANLYLHSTSATCGSTFTASWVGMRNVQVQNCLMSQAAVGNIIESIWNARAGFTYATPELNVGGTNAAPAGNVTAPIEGADWHDDGGTWIPLTAGAMIWDLAKDVNSEGFKKWTITYNGGVASP